MRLIRSDLRRYDIYNRNYKKEYFEKKTSTNMSEVLWILGVVSFCRLWWLNHQVLVWFGARREALNIMDKFYS